MKATISPEKSQRPTHKRRGRSDSTPAELSAAECCRAQIRGILADTGAQAKLTVGDPDDRVEREADIVAQRIAASLPAQVLSRSAPVAAARRTEASSEDGAPSGLTDVAERAIAATGSGRPLDAALRVRLESAMGADLGAVRVHDDGGARAAGRALNARAFTHGRDIWLGPGESQGDIRLMAHEVAHVLQQASALQLPRVQRQAATQRSGRQAPSASGHEQGLETKGYQEASWAQPSMRLATEPVLVGRIYFRTKETTLDAQDEDVLKQLAKAYAPYAKRNIGKAGAPLGLKGLVVGYADPRPSVEPNNQQLSEQRAFWVATRLVRHLSQETGLAEAYFDLAWRGAGVAKTAAEQSKTAAEANVLAALRYADISLAGQATEPAVAPKEAEPSVKPPVLHKWPISGVPEWENAVRSGDKREIKAMALWMVGYLGTSPTGEVLFWTETFTGRKIGDAKPPWWDSRAAGIGTSLGRSAARNRLMAKAALLLRDYVETAKWEEKHVVAKGGSYGMLFDELRKEKPDEGKIKQYILNLQYLNFMMDQTQNLATEVVKLAQE